MFATRFRGKLVAAVVWLPWLAIAICVGSAIAQDDPEPPPDPRRVKAEQLSEKGLFRDAYVIYRALALDPKDDPEKVGADFTDAVHCLEKLKLEHEVPKLRDQVVAVHGTNRQVLYAAAQSIWDQPYEDRSRRPLEPLRLLYRAAQLIDREPNPPIEDAEILLDFAKEFEDNNDPTHWRLNRLTNLDGDLKAEADALNVSYENRPAGAAVDDQGNPIFHRVPKSLAAAKTDGERWRWALKRAVELDPNNALNVKIRLADVFSDLYGTQTLAFVKPRANDDPKFAKGPLALHSLADDETIARLATGVKRFKLPDEFNYLKLFKDLEDAGYYREQIDDYGLLVYEYERRRQFSKAAATLKEELRRDIGNPDRFTGPREYRLSQIEGNRGEFLPVGVQLAGREATVHVRFRNATSMTFEARPILADEAWTKLKRILATRNPDELFSEYSGMNALGRAKFEGNRDLLGDVVARWELKLVPAADHFDKTITVKTPLKDPGLYDVTARPRDGKEFHVLIKIVDKVVVLKSVAGRYRVFVADSIDGRPLPNVNIEVFSSRVVWEDKLLRVKRAENIETTLRTDRDGLALLDEK